MKKLTSHIPGAGCKAKIDYPCVWQYTIIGESGGAIQELVESALADRPYRLERSNVSRTGRYISMNLELTVDDEKQRLAMYGKLAASPHVKVVL